jgi:zinc transport system ATP-binding protein
MSLIQAVNISYTIQWNRLIQDLSLKIEKKQILSIIGYNGSWKSTVLKLLLWSIKPTQWTIKRKPWLSLGYVPQKLSFTQDLPITVNDFISIFNGKSVNELPAVCSHIDISSLKNRPLSGLSWWQLQKVLITNALVNSPDVLLLDEPTAWLDVHSQKEFYELIDHINTTHWTSIVLVSHDIHTVYSKSDTILCLHQWVCCTGAPCDASFSQEMKQLLGWYVTPYLHTHTHDW